MSTPGTPDGPAPDPAEDAPAPATAAAAGPVRAGDPLLPERSREDTDAAWGDYREPSDDRLYQDRPPHWADY